MEINQVMGTRQESLRARKDQCKDETSEKAMAPHSSTLAWKIPWTEEPGRLQSMGWLRVGHKWAISLSLFTFMHGRRKWQPTPVFLPGESQGRWGWWAAVYGVAQSRTRLKQLSSSSSSKDENWHQRFCAFKDALCWRNHLASSMAISDYVKKVQCPKLGGDSDHPLCPIHYFSSINKYPHPFLDPAVISASCLLSLHETALTGRQHLWPPYPVTSSWEHVTIHKVLYPHPLDLPPLVCCPHGILNFNIAQDMLTASPTFSLKSTPLIPFIWNVQKTQIHRDRK